MTDEIDFGRIVGRFLKDGAGSSHRSVPHECSTKEYRFSASHLHMLDEDHLCALLLLLRLAP